MSKMEAKDEEDGVETSMEIYFPIRANLNRTTVVIQ